MNEQALKKVIKKAKRFAQIKRSLMPPPRTLQVQRDGEAERKLGRLH